MSYKREENFRHFFNPFFAQKTSSMKKDLTLFLDYNVAYKMLEQFTKPWTHIRFQFLDKGIKDEKQ